MIMKNSFNKNIVKILHGLEVDETLGKLILLCFYYNLKPTIFDPLIILKIRKSEIFYKVRSKLSFNIPLFGDEDSAFSWVIEEFIPLFKIKNSNKAHPGKETVTRMKKFFSENPAVRKSKIIEATKLYLSKVESRYIRSSHYFIYKGVGVNKTSDLLNALESLKEIKSSETERSFTTNVIQ